MAVRRRWHPSKYDLLTMIGVGLVVSQAIQHAVDGQPSDESLIYGGLAVIGLGLGLRFDQRSEGGSK